MDALEQGMAEILRIDGYWQCRCAHTSNLVERISVSHDYCLTPAPSCDRLPIPLSVCPVCSHGFKQSRGQCTHNRPVSAHCHNRLIVFETRPVDFLPFDYVDLSLLLRFF
jgi:hypothetical protein